MEEKQFADREEAWTYFSEKKIQEYENLSGEDLARLIEEGPVDLFFTLPDVVARKLPREKAILSLFKRVLAPAGDFLVRYHTLDTLMKHLGYAEHDPASAPADSLFNRVQNNYSGERVRLAACRELWDKINEKYDMKKADPNYSPEFEPLSTPETVALEYKFDVRSWELYHGGEARSVKLLELALKEAFEKFKSSAYFSPSASLSFFETVLDADVNLAAALTGFNSAYEIRIFYGKKSSGPSFAQDLSEGDFFIKNPLLVHLIGEKNLELQEFLEDCIADPLGIIDFGFSKFA